MPEKRRATGHPERYRRRHKAGLGETPVQAENHPKRQGDGRRGDWNASDKC
jgi:hypothetical protein